MVLSRYDGKRLSASGAYYALRRNGMNRLPEYATFSIAHVNAADGGRYDCEVTEVGCGTTPGVLASETLSHF